MNFSFESVKLKSKPYNEDFYFDTETPRGHFFSVLDFASHDYANLNATLTGKLETIVGSFVPLSGFSAELFLGFLAKEINNFVHNLGEQSGGPELLCSAALCLVSGNKVFYFLCGDARISILSSGRLLPLHGTAGQDLSEKPGEQAPENLIETSDEALAQAGQGSQRLAQLGGRNMEAPLADQVQAFTMQDDDVVLIMTQGVAETLESEQLAAGVMSLRASDPKLICDSLMKACGASRDDRTLVVISGPYERFLDPVLADLSKSVASVEARLNALTENEQRKDSDVVGLEKSDEAQLEQRLNQQIEVLKEDLRGKAAGIDLLELDEKLKNLSAVLAGKADTAELLGLQRDVLRLGIVANENASSVTETETASHPAAAVETTAVAGVESAAVANRDNEESAMREPVVEPGSAGVLPPSTTAEAERLTGATTARSLTLTSVLLILAFAFAAGFAGGWLQSRLMKKSPELWSVKTSGNQIVISRLDGTGGENVILDVAQPLQSTGKQTFSSFAEVKQYLDTITNPEAQVSQPDNKASEAVNEITVKPGDSLKKLSEIYNVPPEKLQELNPGITKWNLIQSGQKIVVPSPSATPSSTPALASSSPPADQSPANNFAGNTIEVTLGPGDSLNQLARRFNTTADRLKELNPQITNWMRVQTGQKVIVPTPAR